MAGRHNTIFPRQQEQAALSSITTVMAGWTSIS